MVCLLWLLVNWFNSIPKLGTSLSIYVCFLCFFLGSFLLFVYFVPFLLLVFVLSYFIIFYYYPLEACLFSNKRQKRGYIWMRREEWELEE